MRDPAELITWHDQPTPRGVDTSPRVLVHAMTGFVDAGQVQTSTATQLLAGDSRLLATIDTDEVFDYRARRPRMTFVVDHFASIELPEIALYETHDEAGRLMWVLTGPEPDVQWQRFVAAVVLMIERLNIDLTVSLAGIPWPTPHTRPPGVTWHGTDRSMLDQQPAMLGTIEVPGHIGGLLELTLANAGRSALGIAAHVPHYVAQVDYPRAAIALLESLQEATGLTVSTEVLRPGAEKAEADISDQVAQSEEFVSVLAALEQQYDQMSAMRAAAAASAQEFAPDGHIPSGDEIAAQVEQFLADMDEPQDEAGQAS
ncbi:MAG: PAC2 family protein [Candidatus Nanopelagicales bacterium]